MGFEVRVKALASSRLHLCVDEAPLGEDESEILLGGRSWSARLHGREIVGGRVTDVLLRASGFDSAESAQESGERLRDALLLGGVIYGAGFDVGLHDPEFVCDIVNDKIVCVERLGGAGVWVRESADGPHYTAEFGGFSQPVPLGDFFTQVNDVLLSDRRPSPPAALALALYSMSHFLVSSHARFVSLVSAVESISPREKRSREARELVHEMEEGIRNALQSPGLAGERESMARSVRSLARISLGEACRRTIQRFLGDPDVESFSHFYTIRSALLHFGEVRSAVDLDKEVCRLDWLVRRLLIEFVNVSDV